LTGERVLTNKASTSCASVYTREFGRNRCPTTKRTIVTMNAEEATMCRESSSSREEKRINSLFCQVRTKTQREMSRSGGESERKRELGEILN